jgi:Predicted nucleotide-binding protein containing TIR-like domain
MGNNASVPELAQELSRFAERLALEAVRGDQPSIAEPLAELERVAGDVGKAWSGSNMGYQSRVYYADFDPPPPGAHFDSEWGFLGQFQGTTGDWREYAFDDVISIIYRAAGVSSLDEVLDLAQQAHAAWTEVRPEIISVLSAYLQDRPDPLIEQLRTEAEQTNDLTEMQAARALVGPIGSRMVRDTTALSQGFIAAPHQSVQARVIAIRSMFAACSALARIAERGASHMQRLELSLRSRGQPTEASGERVFIGHGRSAQWRELKDFISDRLGLSWDEFNRVPVAGVTNIARLSEMLDNAGIAFLVLTAEDETTDGREVARQNVVHEAGLFQGRLGFTRAIVLLEEACDEFSNIQGLGQIRFPQGRISAAFEEVRRVLEREGFLQD